MQKMDIVDLQNAISRGSRKRLVYQHLVHHLWPVNESGAIGRIFQGTMPSFSRACKILNVLEMPVSISHFVIDHLGAAEIQEEN